MRNTLGLIVIALMLVFAAPFKSFAQYKHSEAFEKGITVIDLNTSFGTYRDKAFVTQRMPIFLGAEYGINNDISAGLFGGWNQRTYKTINSFAYDVNYLYYGGRFSLHLTSFLRKKTILKFNPHKVDVYGTIYVGRQVARQQTFSGAGYLDSGATNIFGGYVGAKVYTNYQVGFLVELGAGPYGIMNLGVCYKF